MKKILKIDASARPLDTEEAKHGSLSRSLSQYFSAQWHKQNSEDLFIHRDVGSAPPGAINQDWIAAAFTPESERNELQKKRLVLSDQLIDEVTQADLILISTPMTTTACPPA